MVCGVCGCKVHRIKGTLHHYGSKVACDRIARLTWSLSEILALHRPVSGEVSDEDGSVHKRICGACRVPVDLAHPCPEVAIVRRGLS